MAEKTEKRPVIRIPSPRRLSRRGQRSEYYDRIASRLRWTKIILAAAVFVFMIGMFWIYRGEITVENIKFTYAENARSGVPAMKNNAAEMCRAGLYFENVRKLTVRNVTVEGCVGDEVTARSVACFTEE